ncbi:MAG: sensor histidine kinase [Elusimicrobiota bacterium]
MAELFKEELKLSALDEFKEELTELEFDLQILDLERNSVVQSGSWNELGVSIEEATFQTLKEKAVFKELSLNNKPYALFSRPIHTPYMGDYSLHIVRSQEPLMNILKTLLWWMVAIKFFMVLLAGIIGYFFAARTLRADERAHQRLKNFTADAAHELRIPLTSLRGNLEVALRKDRPVEEYKETIEGALEEAEHLSQLTQDLLLLAQTDANQLKLNIQDVDLKGFLEDVFSQAEALPDDKKIKKVLLPLPETKVQFDPDRMKQLLLNLIENAIKYGVPNGEMSLGAELASGKLNLIVRDNGIGIPKGEQEKIFDRFYRVDKARSRQQGGSGLGLSIVQWIANAHGGRVRVVSQEGKGSMFTVELNLISPKFQP